MSGAVYIEALGCSSVGRAPAPIVDSEVLENLLNVVYEITFISCRAFSRQLREDHPLLVWGRVVQW